MSTQEEFLRQAHARNSRFKYVAIAALLAAGIWFLLRQEKIVTSYSDVQTAPVVKRTFRQSLVRSGVLKPVSEQRIFTKVGGTILEMAPQSKVVAKDEVVLKLDPTPHEDAKFLAEAAVAQEKASYKKLQQEAAKILNQAKEDVISYDLKVELEQMRLEEIKKGAVATEVINAQVNLENAKALLAAKEEELKVLESLANGGYASVEEVRQKRLDVIEQKLAMEQAEIKYRKLSVIDPVKIGEQQLKVSDALKTRDAAKERVKLLERNMQRDEERYNRRIGRETERLNDLAENIRRTTYLAPGPGVVIHRRSRWYTLAPGREVYDGQEVMALPDFTKMKVVLSVDEGRIAFVRVGQDAEIRPAGWSGAPFKGKVTLVAEKGHDEFEPFQDETSAITGTANRQVFDVEVEIQGQSDILRPGLRADVEIVMQTLQNATVVPRMAVSQDRDGTTIVKVASLTGPLIKPVKVVTENDFSAVIEGVSENERVWVVEP